MSGEAYTKRYTGGFVDLPATSSAIDSAFLNKVEQTLLYLLGADPADGQAHVWDAALARFKTALLVNAHISATAGISRQKLDFGAGLVDADIAAAAAVAISKISGLQTALDAKQASSAKGQANGYASLDANGLVPVTQLPVGIGTTLPASPVDGQEYILVDSLTAPTYQWHFRYVPSITDAYKWVFIGGAELYAETTGTDTTTSGTVANLVNGPTLTVPRAGHWIIEADAVVSNTIADGQTFLSVGDQAVATSQVITNSFGQTAVASRWSTVHVEGRGSGLAATTVLALKAWGTGGGTMSYQLRRITIKPVRVS